MVCLNCKYQITPGALFCPVCGYKQSQTISCQYNPLSQNFLIKLLQIIISFVILALLITNLIKNINFAGEFFIYHDPEYPLMNEGWGIMVLVFIFIYLAVGFFIFVLSAISAVKSIKSNKSAIFILVITKVIAAIGVTLFFSLILFKGRYTQQSVDTWFWIMNLGFIVLYLSFAFLELFLAKKHYKPKQPYIN